mgnify:CR=1 FL=1
MKNIVLAAALALIAVPALAVGPESFTVDVSRGYAVQAPGQAQAQGSNWAPRGQQAQEQASSEQAAPAPRARATKASGKARSHAAPAAQAPAHGKAPAPAAAPAAKH